MSNEYKYQLAYSSAFKKDMKVLSADEKEETKAVIEKLAKGETLEEKYQDHQLFGKLKDFRDCHIRPDLVLIYKIKDNVLELYIYRIESHAKLYKK